MGLNTDDVFGGGDPLSRYSTTAFSDSGVARTSKTKVIWATCFNNFAGNRWLMLFDSATVPANGTVPEDFVQAPSTTQVFIDFRPDIAKYSNGVSWALSSTPDTLTLAGADALVRIYYRSY